MFLEICMQIYSVVFSFSRQINKQKVYENNWSPCEGNKIFVNMKLKGGVLTPKPPPSVRSWSGLWFWEQAMFCYVFIFEKRPNGKVKGDDFAQGEN